MGIHLVMEAADRGLDGLTWRERCVLMILAASAIDATRECPAGIENRPDIIRPAVSSFKVQTSLARGRDRCKAERSPPPAGPGADRGAPRLRRYVKSAYKLVKNP